MIGSEEETHHRPGKEGMTLAYWSWTSIMAGVIRRSRGLKVRRDVIEKSRLEDMADLKLAEVKSGGWETSKCRKGRREEPALPTP